MKPDQFSGDSELDFEVRLMGCRQGLFKPAHRSLIGIGKRPFAPYKFFRPQTILGNGKRKNKESAKSTKNSGKQERVTELDSCGPSCQQCTEGTQAIHQGEGKP